MRGRSRHRRFLGPTPFVIELSDTTSIIVAGRFAPELVSSEACYYGGEGVHVVEDDVGEAEFLAAGDEVFTAPDQSSPVSGALVCSEGYSLCCECKDF
jgi:hypothetical protein